MVCSVKQAATGEYPVGRGPTSRRPTTKEVRQVSDDKAKLTEHFIVTLPHLLAKVNILFTCCVFSNKKYMCWLKVLVIMLLLIMAAVCFKAAYMPVIVIKCTRCTPLQ